MYKLSRKLKFISMASAIVMCSTMSATVQEASASPISLWGRLRGIFLSGSRGSANITTDTGASSGTLIRGGAGRLPVTRNKNGIGGGNEDSNLNASFLRNGPGRNPITRDRGGLGGARIFTTGVEGNGDEPLQVPRVHRDYLGGFGEDPQKLLNGLYQKENKSTNGTDGPTKFARKKDKGSQGTSTSTSDSGETSIIYSTKL